MSKPNLEHTSTGSVQAIRHSLAHLLAASVLELYPDATPTIGPAIDNGFYYDFDTLTISDSDLLTIEKKMRELLPAWKSFEKTEVSADEARKQFKDNKYKLELIDELEKEGQAITFYTSGGFTDLCRGGHVENPAKDIESDTFKLTHTAGAYWRGDENNPMLTRIYGLAFATKKELDEYLAMQEEAKKRDHKKLGRELDLFTFSDLVGAGLPLWTPKGTLVYKLLDEYVWQLRKARGYVRVEIPHITKKDLFVTSGHWDKFSDELFNITTREGHEFALKPMNCPFHTQIFDRRPHSYREMPQRYANTTMQYRDEQSGELSGLSRVRSISIDDAHVFCRYSQVKEEAGNIWDIVHEFYGTMGFPLEVTLSLHDPDNMDAYLGDEKVWEEAENQLRELVREKKSTAREVVGEAAFYGPKIDFISTDSLGREWQVATIQLDMNMPSRFELTCINENGEKEPIAMLHAAIMGSIERFLSVYIEHTSGAFPLWLSPVQITVLPIGEDHKEYAEEITQTLKEHNIRVELDDSDETLGKRIRNWKISKVPYALVIGDSEVESKKLKVESRENDKSETLSLEKLLNKLQKEIEEKRSS